VKKGAIELAKTATTEAVKVPIDMGIKNSFDK